MANTTIIDFQDFLPPNFEAGSPLLTSPTAAPFLELLPATEIFDNLSVSFSQNTRPRALYSLDSLNGDGDFSGNNVVIASFDESFLELNLVGAEAIAGGTLQFRYASPLGISTILTFSNSTPTTFNFNANTAPNTYQIPEGAPVSTIPFTGMVNSIRFNGVLREFGIDDIQLVDLQFIPTAIDDGVVTALNTPVTIDVLNNDSDRNNDPLSISTISPPSNGTVVINNNQTPGNFSDDFVIYTPNVGFTGSDSFTYTIGDGMGNIDTATVTISVITPQNMLPNAIDDGFIINEDSILNANVLNANSGLADVLGDIPATITAVNGMESNVGANITLANSMVMLNADGTFTFSPNANFNGMETFAYTLTDANGDTDTAIVAITITPSNDPPVALNDVASTLSDMNITIAVLSNDMDIDSDPLTISAFDGMSAMGGLVVLDSGMDGIANTIDDGLIYTPFVGGMDGDMDTFNYTITDGMDGTATATVTVSIIANVIPVDLPPDAIADNFTIEEDMNLSGSLFANDTLGDIPTTVMAADMSVNGGVVNVANDGMFTYAPVANFNGTDSFSYTLIDVDGDSDTATVTITITPINDPPVALNDVASTLSNMNIPIAVLSNDMDIDGDPLTISTFDGMSAMGGLVVLDSGMDGIANTMDDGLIYTPFTGSMNGDIDTFNYSITDGMDGTATATVTVSIIANVIPVDLPPDAIADSFTIGEDMNLNGNLFADNGMGADILRGATTVIAFDGMSTNGGVVTVANDGIFTYAPVANFNGTDSFSYTLNDVNGGSDTASVTITITPSNDPPVALNDVASTLSNMNITIAVLSNDMDIDGDPLTIGTFDGMSAMGGTIVFANPDSLLYTPFANAMDGDIDTFNYTTADGMGGTATATVTVTINSPPIVDMLANAIDDSFTIDAGTTASGDLLANDILGDIPTMVTAFDSMSANGGMVAVSTGGMFTYSPALNFSGIDSFTYTITDSDGDTDRATVTIEVIGLPTVVASDNSSTRPSGMAVPTDLAQFVIARPVNAQGIIPTGGLLPVSFTIGGNAILSEDYEITSTGQAFSVNGNTGSLTIRDASSFETITIVPRRDNDANRDQETVTISVGNTSATVTINNPPLPVVNVLATLNQTSEPSDQTSQPGIFSLTRSGDNSEELIVTATFLGTAMNGQDFELVSTTVTIPANQSTTTVAIAPLADALVEGVETVILAIAPNPNYTIGSGNTATVSIDDIPPIVNIIASDSEAQEPSPGIALNNGRFTISRSGARDISGPLTIPFTIAGTATSGTDYTSISSSVTIPANQNSATIDINPLGDILIESSETVVLNLNASANYAIGNNPQATVTIVDTPLPTVTIVATDNLAREPVSGRTSSPDDDSPDDDDLSDDDDSSDDSSSSQNNIINPGEFTISRSAPLNNPLTVNYTIGGTASNGVDYTSISQSLTIAAGQTSATITIAPLTDSLVEGNETVLLTLTSNQNYTIGTQNNATVTIEDSTLSLIASDDTILGSSFGQSSILNGTSGDDTLTASLNTTPIVIPFSTILANDFPTGGVTITAVTAIVGGTPILNTSAQTITFNPAFSSNNTHQFSYTIVPTSSFSPTDNADVRVFLVAINTINGLDGDDSIVGSSGNDSLIGGDDDDLIIGGSGNDSLIGGDGNDSITAGSGNDLVSGGEEDDILFGSTGNDRVEGGPGDNTVFGGAGSDVLIGGPGDDLFDLFGLPLNNSSNDNINDTVTGNSGSNFFFVDFAPRNSIITDFVSDQDIILVATIDSDPGFLFFPGIALGNLPVTQFVSGTVATNSEHRFIYDSISGILSFDQDGSGSLFAQIPLLTLQGGSTISHTDILGERFMGNPDLGFFDAG